MGWTYSHREKEISVKAFFKGEFGEGFLDCATVGMREAYIAYKMPTGQIICVVCLLDYKKNDYYNFGYKDMSEDMGPYYYNCPKKIFDMLTPTESKHAKEWREKVKAQHEKGKQKIESGMLIKFADKITFQGGYVADTFQIMKDGRKVLFRMLENSLLCNITNWKKRDYQIITV